MKETSFENKEKSNTMLKICVIIGLAIFSFGLLVHQFGTNFEQSNLLNDGSVVDFIGKFIILIGMIMTSIILMSIALFKTKVDVTIRFGCLLVGGIVIAFEMIAFV